MVETTIELETTRGWLNEILPDNRRAFAAEIAEWVLSIGASYPEIQIKAFKTNKPDVRFCFDRGSDCLGIKIYTGFFIIGTSQAFSARVLPESDVFNKYKKYLKKGNKFYDIREDDARNLWKRNELNEGLKEIINHAFLSWLKTKGNIKR